MRRAIRIAVMAGCFVAGAGLFLLAADITRWGDALRDGDIRFVAAPEERGLWHPAEIVPNGIGREVLAIEDDLTFRIALRAVRLSRPHVPSLSDPALVILRNESTARLTEILQASGPTERRSAAANLLGVLSFSDSQYDYENRKKLLASATSRFRQAVDLDPENADAKHNLELTLARSEAIELTESGGGPSPAPGGKGAKGAGTGDPGSGY